MAKLNIDQRSRIAEKVIELGNLFVAGFVISQIIPGPPKSLIIGATGVILGLGFYLMGYIIMKAGKIK